MKCFITSSPCVLQSIFNTSPASVAELKKFHVGVDGVRIGQLIVRGKTSKVIRENIFILIR